MSAPRSPARKEGSDMKRDSRINLSRVPQRSSTLPLIALAVLAACPQPAAAQAVGGYMRGGGGSGNTAPAQNEQNQPRTAQPQSVQPQLTRPEYAQPQPVRPKYTQPQAMRQPEPIPRQYSPMRSGAISNSQTFPLGIDPVPSYSHGPAVIVPEEMPRPLRPTGRYREQSHVNNQYNNSQNSSNQSYSDPQYNPTRLVAPVGPDNGFFNNSTLPVGPGNGYFNAPVRITTPQGPQYLPRQNYQNNYVYNTVINPSPVIVGAPSLLGGYYYGNYCDNYVQNYTYPSIYSSYYGFPRYLYNPTVIVVSQPYCPVYTTSYLPFYPPLYPVTYNENNYYFTNEERTRDIEAGGERAKDALRNSYPAGSYQAAFADIARAWTDGDVKLLRRHTRDADTRLSVFLKKKYSYSIASGDFLQITRDALDRLNTVSFDFTRLRKAKNGDVTAFGKHVYRVADSANNTGESDTVPFDQNGIDGTDASPYSQSADPASGEKKTVYVSYTLRHKDDKWYIIAVDSSEHSLTASE